MDKYILEKLFNMRPEWLNEKMATEADSAYGEGWNACNKVWLANLAALHKEVDEKGANGGLINRGDLSETYGWVSKYEDGSTPESNMILSICSMCGYYINSLNKDTIYCDKKGSECVLSLCEYICEIYKRGKQKE